MDAHRVAGWVVGAVGLYSASSCAKAGPAAPIGDGTESGNVLKTLESVDWSKLRHAYGAAGDLPDLLTALTSPGASRRSKARFELYGRIVHQGTVYDSTPAAATVLVEMAGQADTPDRASILDLLGAIAVGEADEALEARCRGAVAPVVPLARDLLKHSDGTLRRSAGALLAAVPVPAPEVDAALRAALGAEPDGAVRAGLAFALWVRARDKSVAQDLLEHTRRDEEPIVVLVGALGAVDLLGAEAPRAAVAIVADALQHEEQLGEAFGEVTRGLRDLESEALEALVETDVEMADLVLPALESRFDPNVLDVHGVIPRHILRYAFRAGRASPPISPGQLRALSVIAAHDEAWTAGGLPALKGKSKKPDRVFREMAALMESYGLPATQEGLRSLLAQ